MNAANDWFYSSRGSSFSLEFALKNAKFYFSRIGHFRSLASLTASFVRACLMLLLALTAAHALSVSAQEPRYVEISAEVDMVSYVKRDTNGAPIETKRSFQFTCIVGTNEWRIETGFSPFIQDTWYYDGTDVYEANRTTNDEAFVQMKQFSQKMRPRPALADPEIIKSNLTIHVTPSLGGHPLGDLGVNIPWLAYCSGSYLKQQARVIPLPTTVISEAEDAFAYVDKTVTFPDQFGLPYTLDLLTSKDQYRRGLEDKRIYRNTPAALAALNPVVPADPDGTLKFHYEVKQVTNFDGWQFPTQFSYVDYRPDRKGGWHPYVAGLGKMLSIRECGPPASVFDTNLQQTVQDFRFRHPTKVLDAITYTTTNSALWPTNDPRLQAEFKRLAVFAPLEHGISIRRGRIIFGIMVVLLAFVPLFWSRLKSRNSR